MSCIRNINKSLVKNKFKAIPHDDIFQNKENFAAQKPASPSEFFFAVYT